MQSAHPRVLLETDIKQKAQRDRPHWERQLWGNRGFASRAAKKEHGLRLPASASCLGRHSHPAGRCPNSSSLFRPLAALVAVALGCFCAVFSDVAAAVRIHPRLWPQRSYIRKTPVYFYTSVFLVGAGGFEPPKLKAADLQSVPIGHSGTRPYSLFVSFAGRLVYSIMQKGFCQLFFYLFLQMRFPCRETAGKALQPCRHGKVGEKSQPEEIDRQIARKTRDNM